MTHRFIVLLTAVTLFTLPAMADFTRDMETDRPDFTEGTQTVEAKHFQIETGYTYTSNDDGGVERQDHVAPEFLLRAGLLDDLEFRFFWEGYAWSDTETSAGTDGISGTTDISLGFKHHMYDQDGWIPHFAVIAELGVPSGSKAFTADDSETALKLLWAYDVTDETGIAGNLNFASVIGEEERFLEISNSLSVATSLTEEIGGYFEYYGFYPADSVVETSTHYLNGGFTYAVTPDLQLDIRAGFGVNEAADDFLAGAGISFRI